MTCIYLYTVHVHISGPCLKTFSQLNSPERVCQGPHEVLKFKAALLADFARSCSLESQA